MSLKIECFFVPLSDLVSWWHLIIVATKAQRR
jgi:hypothetical protein